MIKKYYIDYKTEVSIPSNVSCIGFFDAVHLGHQALIKKTVELAKEKKVEPFVITFYPDPNDVVNGYTTKHINSFDKRMKLFEKYKIKGVIIIEFNDQIRNLKPFDFAALILKKLNIKGLVCGFDFHYGFNGVGDAKSLKEDMKDFCEVSVVDEVKFYGKKISSNRILDEIDKGNIEKANKLLGYKYRK